MIFDSYLLFRRGRRSHRADTPYTDSPNIPQLCHIWQPVIGRKRPFSCYARVVKSPPSYHEIVFLDGAYLPGKEARISIFDRGFLLSDGVFETLHIERGTPLHLREHLDRLRRSAAALSITVPWSDWDLTQTIRRLLQRNGLLSCAAPEAALRITLTRGVAVNAVPTLLMTLRRLVEGHTAKREDGVRLFGLNQLGRQAHLAQHKTLSYLSSALGRLKLADLTDDPRSEGLFVTDAGVVLEGTASNIFILLGNELITAPVKSGVLKGIARAVVLDLASVNDAIQSITERTFDVTELRRADEVFITASTLHISAGVSFDGVAIGRGVRGGVYRQLRQAYDIRVNREVDAWHHSG